MRPPVGFALNISTHQKNLLVKFGSRYLYVQLNRELEAVKDSRLLVHLHSPSQDGNTKITGSHTHDSDGKISEEGTDRAFRSLDPFGQPKSVREINEAIKAELLKPCPAGK